MAAIETNSVPRRESAAQSRYGTESFADAGPRLKIEPAFAMKCDVETLGLFPWRDAKPHRSIQDLENPVCHDTAVDGRGSGTDELVFDLSPNADIEADAPERFGCE